MRRLCWRSFAHIDIFLDLDRLHGELRVEQGREERRLGWRQLMGFGMQMQTQNEEKGHG